ncbi:nitroreductase family deazaflavin-dependent oxidoreductase [Williamsia sp.]|uniref:nitroreductase family deazaflavin-dependent oxidoreductase n=1 Tax=Williamsia sp. TaxID=1872085 RepID=UPI001A259323|nr:nitroreductase family deazaflavin-dependent oxidoreductase [Williamsia sp.]MBJ7288476.1 nitroreductase family deazaflavin-dependent oxidoreductase [Williamsia sp.]
MGLLTPLAVKIGAISWMPKALPQIEKWDSRLQRVTSGRVSVLDIAGLPNLMLRVPGRKSGAIRSTPLLCVPHEGGWLIAGSYFGAQKMPVWVLNLRATDQAAIIVDRETVSVAWREVAGAERARLWEVMVGTWPNFTLYEKRTDREIPVFVLTRR